MFRTRSTWALLLAAGLACMAGGVAAQPAPSPAAPAGLREFFDAAWERLRESLGDDPCSTEHPHCLTFLAALGHLRRDEAIPYLQVLLQQTEDSAIRESARESLARLGDREAISHYCQQLLAPNAADDDARAAWARSAQKATEVLADVRAGYVSLESARRDYGVVIRQQGRRFELDAEATRELRRTRAQ